MKRDGSLRIIVFFLEDNRNLGVWIWNLEFFRSTMFPSGTPGSRFLIPDSGSCISSPCGVRCSWCILILIKVNNYCILYCILYILKCVNSEFGLFSKAYCKNYFDNCQCKTQYYIVLYFMCLTRDMGNG